MAKNKKATGSTWNLLPDSERQIMALHAIADNIGCLAVTVAVGIFVYAVITLTRMLF